MTRSLRIGILRVPLIHRNWNSKDDQIPRDWNSKGAGSIGIGILRTARSLGVGILGVPGIHRNWNSKDDQIPLRTARSLDWNSKIARDPSELEF